MSKIKELWQHAVFRYIVLLIFCWVGAYILFGFLSGSYILRIKGFNSNQDEYLAWSILIPILLIFWVWRKPIWKLIGFLNKKAEED